MCTVTKPTTNEQDNQLSCSVMTVMTVICSVFISIGTYLLLMFDESNPKSEGRIFLLKTFNFRFQMIESLTLSLNGISAALFESFSLLRLSFAFGHGWLALKLARNLKIKAAPFV